MSADKKFAIMMATLRAAMRDTVLAKRNYLFSIVEDFSVLTKEEKQIFTALDDVLGVMSRGDEASGIVVWFDLEQGRMYADYRLFGSQRPAP
jgi:hypothetical protein